MNNEEFSSISGGKWKELVAGMLAVSISFIAFSSVALAKNDKKEKGNKADVVSASKGFAQEEYDKEQLEGYLTGAGYTEEDNLKISQKFSMGENTEVSYVFSGDDIIGSYLTTEVNGEEMSSFTFDSTSDEVQSVYEPE